MAAKKKTPAPKPSPTSLLKRNPDGSIVGATPLKKSAKTAAASKSQPSSTSLLKRNPDGSIIGAKPTSKATIAKTAGPINVGTIDSVTAANQKKQKQALANMYTATPSQVAKIRALEAKSGLEAQKTTLSALGTLIDTISTPLYAVEGAIYAGLTGKNPLAGAADNAFSWVGGKAPKTGVDILKAAGVDTTKDGIIIPEGWFLGGTNLSGLALDVALDPLTYLTAGAAAAIKTLAKAPVVAAKSALKAVKMTEKGLVSKSLAEAGTPVRLVAEAEMRPVLKESYKKLAGPKAQAKVQATEAYIKRVRYKAVEAAKTADGELKNVGAQSAYKVPLTTKAIIAAEAGIRANLELFAAAKAANYLRKYARRDIKKTIKKDWKTDEFFVATKNKDIEFGRFATKAEAKTLKKDLKKGRAVTPPIVTTVETAARVNKDIQEGVASGSVALPTETGEKIVIEPYVPYEQADGKVYVSDGKDIRAFDNVNDAKVWVNIANGPAPEVATVKVVSTQNGWRARVGNKVEDFGPGPEGKKAAMEYKQAFETGQISGRPVTTQKGANLIIDSAPPKFDMQSFIKAPALSGDNAALKKILTDVDKYAKSAIATRAANSPELAARVWDIVSGVQEKTDEFIRKNILANEGIVKSLQAAANGDIQPFIVLRDFKDSKNPIENKLFELFSKAGITIDGTQTTVGKLFSRGGVTGFFKLPDFAQAAIIKLFSNFSNRINTLGATTKAAGKETITQQLVKLLGKTDAQRVIETGILEGQTPTTNKKLKEILDSLSVKTEKVTYSNVDELIAGVKNGDSVDYKTLEKIFSAIDPEGKLDRQMQKIAGETPSAFLSRVLISDEAVQTIADTQRRLALAGDVELLMRSTGLGYDDIVVNYIQNARAGKGFEYALEDTAEAAALRLKETWGKSRTPDQIANAIARGFFGQFTELEEIVRANGYNMRTSSFGNLAHLNAIEAYSPGSKAVLSHQINQHLETKMIASLLGTTQKRIEAKWAGAETLDTIEKRRNFFIDQMDMASDMFITMGTRIVRTKNRADDLVEAAFQKGKKKGSFVAEKEKHFVYLHMGDIFKAFRDTGAGDLLDAAFFAGKNPKVDSLDWISFGDAQRLLLEAKGKNIPLTKEYIVERLLRRGEGRGKAGKEFQNQSQQLAEAIADHMLNNVDFVAQLEKYHLSKAIGLADDAMKNADMLTAEVFNTLYEGWKINYLSQNLSKPAREAAMREMLRKFVWATNTLKAHDSEIAQMLFKSRVLMFMQGGNLAQDLSTLSREAQERLIALGSELRATPVDKDMGDFIRNEEQAFMKAVHQLQQELRAGEGAPPRGLEGTKKPTPLKQDQAATRLGTAEELYAEHMRIREETYNSGDNAAIAKWESEFNKLQKRLDSARENARKNWLPTRHWSDEFGNWVDSSVYDHAAEIARIEEIGKRYRVTSQGAEDKIQYLADTRPVIPPHTVLTAKQRKKFFDDYVEKQSTIQRDIHLSDMEQNAETIAKQLDNGEFEAAGVPEDGIPMRAVEEYHSRNMGDAVGIEVKLTPSAAMSLYEAIEATPMGGTLRSSANLQKRVGMAQKFYSPSGKEQVIQLKNTFESAAMTSTSHFASAMDRIQRKYAPQFYGKLKNKNFVNSEEFSIVFDALKTGAVKFLQSAKGKRLSANAKSFYNDMKPFVDAIYSPDGKSLYETYGITSEDLRAAFKRVGLDEGTGFYLPSKMTPSQLGNPLDWLPFGSKPKGFADGSQEAATWLKQKEVFEKANLNGFLAMTRVFEAIQFAKAERGVAMDFLNNFGWKAYEGMTYEKALAEGWVSIKGNIQGTAARYLPKPEEGALFPPNIADQFELLLREIDSMTNGSFSSNAKLNQFANGVSEWVNLVKAWQTIFNLRHHVTNIFGDTTTALLLGGVKDPAVWAAGWRIGMKHATGYVDEKIVTSITDKRIERDFIRVMRTFSGDTKSIVGVDKAGKNAVSLTVYSNGKPTLVNLSDDELISLFETRGIIVNNIFSSDLQNLSMSNELLSSSAAKNTMLGKAAKRAKLAYTKIERPVGDFTAAYGNMIRTAHAIHVLKSRSWASLDDALMAAADTLNKFHPTVQSLTMFERRYARMAFSYYTWMKTAHVAFAHILVNKSGMITLPMKMQYGQAEGAGLEPQSFGTPWQNTAMAPYYLTSSPYGPTQVGKLGPQITKPAFLTMDVMANWGFTIDTTDPAANILAFSKEQNNFLYTAAKMVSSNLSLGAKPILSAMGQDPSTLGPTKMDTPQNTLDYLLSYIGPVAAARGMGYYEPAAKNVEAQKGLKTPQQKKEYLIQQEQQKKNALLNWLGVTRGLSDVYTPANVTIATSELNKRIKALLEEKNKK